jgi:(1->4)-alpha-D-glucan 1-alpha-D-glucosylmutase
MEPLLARTVSSSALDHAPHELASMLDFWHDGRIKMFITAAGLRLRRAWPDLFRRGSYVPVTADGIGREHIVACARHDGSRAVLAAVPRLVASARLDVPGLGRDRQGWGDTRLRLPPEWRGRALRSVLTGTSVKPIRTSHDTWLLASQAFDVLPVSLLVAETPEDA